MKSSNNPYFRATYQFGRDLPKVKASVLGNLLLLLVFLIHFSNNQAISTHAFYCLGSALFVGTIYFFYNWKNPAFNLLIIGFYLIIFVIEMFTLGIPESPLPIERYGIGKGALLDLAMFIVPYLYAGLRLGFVVPLIQIYMLSKKLPKEEYQR